MFCLPCPEQLFDLPKVGASQLLTYLKVRVVRQGVHPHPRHWLLTHCLLHCYSVPVSVTSSVAQVPEKCKVTINTYTINVNGWWSSKVLDPKNSRHRWYQRRCIRSFNDKVDKPVLKWSDILNGGQKPFKLLTADYRALFQAMTWIPD